MSTRTTIAPQLRRWAICSTLIMLCLVSLSQSFAALPNWIPKQQHPSLFPLTLQKNSNDSDSSSEKDKGDDARKEILSEEENARRVANRLLLPSRIGEAFNRALWTVVLFTLILNVFGYTWVRKDNGAIVLDTIENKRFQDEINRNIPRGK